MYPGFISREVYPPLSLFWNGSALMDSDAATVIFGIQSLFAPDVSLLFCLQVCLLFFVSGNAFLGALFVAPHQRLMLRNCLVIEKQWRRLLLPGFRPGSFLTCSLRE